MQIKITKLVLDPVPTGVTSVACTVGWRCAGSTGAYMIVTNAARAKPDGTLIDPVIVTFDETVCTSGIQVMAYTNCGGVTRVEPVNPPVPTTTSTTSSTTTLAPGQTSTTTTSTTLAPGQTSTTTTTTTICPNVTDIEWEVIQT